MENQIEYKNGLPYNGVFKDNNYQGTYKDGVLIHELILYHNGVKKIENIIINNNENKVIWYDYKGGIIGELLYKNKQPFHGILITKKNGDVNKKTLFNNGEVTLEIYYNNNHKYKSIEFENNKPKQVIFFNDNQIMGKLTYHNGLPYNGEDFKYTNQHKLTDINKYQNGKLISQKIYTNNGETMKEIRYDEEQNKKDITFYRNNDIVIKSYYYINYNHNNNNTIALSVLYKNNKPIKIQDIESKIEDDYSDELLHDYLSFYQNNKIQEVIKKIKKLMK